MSWFTDMIFGREKADLTIYVRITQTGIGDVKVVKDYRIGVYHVEEYSNGGYRYRVDTGGVVLNFNHLPTVEEINRAISRSSPIRR